MGKVVVWSRLALKQTEAIHKYILEDSGSLKIADDVFDKIFKSAELLSSQPKKHPSDQYKLNNDGSYRAYEVFSFRIAYRIFKNEIEY